MTAPEPTAEAVALFRRIDEIMMRGDLRWPDLGVVAAHAIDQALQAERDKERDAVVAWLRERADNRPILDDATSADVQRAGFAKEIITVFADAIAANQHRSAEHV